VLLGPPRRRRRDRELDISAGGHDGSVLEKLPGNAKLADGEALLRSPRARPARTSGRRRSRSRPKATRRPWCARITDAQAAQVKAQALKVDDHLMNLASTQAATAAASTMTPAISYNHLHFHERLAIEVERSQRSGLALSLLMLDVDHFKQFNDTFGHPAGDEVLRQLARVLADARRDGDVVTRYGGEEFAVILVDTTKFTAAEVAEQIRQRVFAHDSPKPPSAPAGSAYRSASRPSSPTAAMPRRWSAPRTPRCPLGERDPFRGDGPGL
jgi:diguanylate cyclase (GGDEF)-like protein